MCLFVSGNIWDETWFVVWMQFVSFDCWLVLILIVWTFLFWLHVRMGSRTMTTHHSSPTHIFCLSMRRLRETSCWHEMWPTCSVPSQPSKIHWSRSHQMLIKICWYVILLSFRPNSLNRFTNLEELDFGVLEGNTTSIWVHGGMEVGGRERGNRPKIHICYKELRKIGGRGEAYKLPTAYCHLPIATWIYIYIYIHMYMIYEYIYIYI